MYTTCCLLPHCPTKSLESTCCPSMGDYEILGLPRSAAKEQNRANALGQMWSTLGDVLSGEQSKIQDRVSGLLPLLSADILRTSPEGSRRCWTPRDLEGSAGLGAGMEGETSFSLFASFILLGVFLGGGYSINV